MYRKHETQGPDEDHRDFAAALQAMRTKRGMSLATLAMHTHYSRAHLTNIEHRRRMASPELAQACDEALDAGGSLEALIPSPRQSQTESMRRPAQLPAPAGRFVGRAGNLSRLDAVSVQSDNLSIAVIHGPPGVGKTTTALHWAHQHEADFEDGQLFADLRGHSRHRAPADPAEILEEFLTALGLSPQEVPETEEKRARLFRTMTHNRRILIVLDNAVSSEQVRPLLPGTARSMVLVTTRTTLTGLAVTVGATQLALRSFTPEDSLRLLRDVVGPRVDQEPDAARAVLDRCGHLPLAVAVAAERIAVHPIRLRDLADDLAEERERLATLAADDEDTDVRAVFSWSYRALPAGAATMFRLLGLHPGKDISVAAAAALADIPIKRAQSLLRTLAVGHLVEETDHDHFRLHDLLRIYAIERVTEENTDQERDQAQTRELSWYLHTAEAAGYALEPYRRATTGVPQLDYTEAFSWCEQELPNFAPIVVLASKKKILNFAWRIPQALFPFFHLRKPWTIWDRTYQIGLQAIADSDSASTRAELLTGLGLVRLGLGDYESGLTAFQQALELLINGDDPAGIAWCHVGIGLAHVGIHNYQKAREHFEISLTIQCTQNDRHGESVTLVHLADACREGGLYEDALQYSFRALSLCRSLGDKYCEGLSLQQIGRAQLSVANSAAAVHYLEEALAIQRDARDGKGEAETLEALSHALAADGDAPTARTYLEEAAVIFGRRGDPAAVEVRARLNRLNSRSVE